MLLQAVLALDFHPTVSVLASGSRDCTVKFYDYSKPSVKRSYRSITDVVGINSIHFHPSGDYMLVGTAQSTREEGERGRERGREGRREMLSFCSLIQFVSMMLVPSSVLYPLTLETSILMP